MNLASKQRHLGFGVPKFWEKRSKKERWLDEKFELFSEKERWLDEKKKVYFLATFIERIYFPATMKFGPYPGFIVAGK